MPDRDRTQQLLQAIGRTLRPQIEDERKFVEYQIDLRTKAGPVLGECMFVLDIIDTKTGSLLQYISIALAIMLFAFGMISGKDFRMSSETLSVLSILILGNIVLSIVAIVLCLSCLNIVGAHTVFELSEEEYESHIIKVTLGRRNRYRLAHRISIITALSLLGVFLILAVNYATIFSDPGYSPIRGATTIIQYTVTGIALLLPAIVLFGIRMFRPTDEHRYPGWYVGCAAAFLASLSWGVGNYVTSLTARHYAPGNGIWPHLDIALYNYLGGALALSLALLLEKRDKPHASLAQSKRWLPVIGLGLACVVLKSANTILFVLATSVIRASSSALLENAQVLWIGLGLVVLRRTKRPAWVLSACAGVFASTYVILRADSSPLNIAGLVMGTGSGIAYAAFISAWVKLQRQLSLSSTKHALLLITGTLILLVMAGPVFRSIVQSGGASFDYPMKAVLLQVGNGMFNVGLTYFLVAFAGEALKEVGSLGLVVVSFGLSYSIIVTQMVEDLVAHRAPSIRQLLGSLAFSICFVILRYACEPRLEVIEESSKEAKPHSRKRKASLSHHSRSAG